MQIYPAIDLRGGQCVRLRQGDYQRETVFGSDPVAVARQWVEQGATWLHVVDLDGAKAGRPCNSESILGIVQAAGVPIQLGGGLRSTEHLQHAFSLGITRAIIGTNALRDPSWVEQAAIAFPNRLVLGLDARDGRIATEGWLDLSNTSPLEIAQRFERLPIAAIAYTDISKDGMLTGPNFASLSELASQTRKDVIASGGVTTVDDVRRLAALGLAGCIIGRALYEDRLRLPDALAAAQASQAKWS